MPHLLFNAASPTSPEGIAGGREERRGWRGTETLNPARTLLPSWSGGPHRLPFFRPQQPIPFVPLCMDFALRPVWNFTSLARVNLFQCRSCKTAGAFVRRSLHHVQSEKFALICHFLNKIFMCETWADRQRTDVALPTTLLFPLQLGKRHFQSGRPGSTETVVSWLNADNTEL